MPGPEIRQETASSRNGSSLALLRLPAVFTQDRLLQPDEFLRSAQDRGLQVDAASLSMLHKRRILQPLFRETLTASRGREVPSSTKYHGMNPRSWAFDAAREGRLRDPFAEGHHRDWVFSVQRHDDEYWRPGWFYSSWQLVDVLWATRQLPAHHLPHIAREAIRRRRVTLALCALSTRHVPAIRGTLSRPGDVDHEELLESRYLIDESDRLSLVEYATGDLRGDAESLLWAARSDPMLEWWPLIRHSGEAGWKRLKGLPAHYAAQRIAAEVLLRAHEELAHLDQLPALPLMSSIEAGVLADRVGIRHKGPPSLERALGVFGLAPHPRVLLLVEGATEEYHFRKLLAELDLDRPNLVRLQSTGGSDVDTNLIVRYAVAPRILEDRDGTQVLHSHPTALVIAMDPEGKWSPAKREKTLKALRTAVREQVSGQLDGSGVITEDELDFLVSIHVWNDGYFELAHFNDQEIVAALRQMAENMSTEVDAAWEARAFEAIRATRLTGKSLDDTFFRLGLFVDKLGLAQLLHPVLEGKIKTQLDRENTVLPILRVLRDVQAKVASLNGPGYYALGDAAT